MCGIVGAIGSCNVVPILLKGLERLEYRGYDSCGVAVIAQNPQLEQDTGLQRVRSTSRVSELWKQVQPDHPSSGLEGKLGIAHTRWATHGAPVVHNAHPHFSKGGAASSNSCPRIGLVHNGIIENYEILRDQLIDKGYEFESQTDTEVITHLIEFCYEGDLFQAVQKAVKQLKGAYAIAVLSSQEPDRMVGAREGSPLIVGIGKNGERFLASDAMALAGVTDQIAYLEEGDIIDLKNGDHQVIDRNFQPVDRKIMTVSSYQGAADLGPYQHYMQKEIFEQPEALANTLEGLEAITPDVFIRSDRCTESNADMLARVKQILVLACGTSYYSACVAKYWIEAIAKIPTHVEIASEYRYRESVSLPQTLVVTISQSGETADTLAALRHAQSMGMNETLTICNVATSAMVRECALSYITRAGVEVGVASTKAFTTQLAGLFLLAVNLARVHQQIDDVQAHEYLQQMRHLPVALQGILALEPQIVSWAQQFANKENALFLGRGMHYPIALEGALKLKEISYIHAEAYPAGELKHGPLALVTEAMPVVVVAPNDALLEKLKSNMQEVRARGGQLYVLADADSHINSEEGIHVIRMPEHYGMLSPLLHVVPLQLLAYHTACLRGSDVDKPRNLAKSVTVE